MQDVVLENGGVGGSDRCGVHLTGPTGVPGSLDVIAFLSLNGLRLAAKTDEWLAYYQELTLATHHKLVDLIGKRRGKDGLIPAGMYAEKVNNCSKYAERFFCYCCTTPRCIIGDCDRKDYCFKNSGFPIPSHVAKNYPDT